MPARSRTGPPQSIAPILVVSAICIAAVSSWFGAPAIGVLWLCLIVVAWLEPQVTLTGKKDDWGYPTPANPSEEARLRSFRRWKQLHTSLIPIPGLATGLGPGWPLPASWCAGVWAAGIAWFVPVIGNRYIHSFTGHVIDAGAAFMLVVEIAAARRAVGPPNHPGTRLDKLVPTIRRSPGAMFARMSAGVIAGIVLATVIAHLSQHFGARFGWPGLIAQLHLNRHLAHPGFALGPIWILYALLVIGTPLLAIAKPWQKTALETWVDFNETNAAWRPRWIGLKVDPPTLIEHRVLGTATVDTFEAPPQHGSAGFLPLGPKLAPALGPGIAVAVLERPDDVDGVPRLGTVHPRRFDVVTWSAAALVNPTTASDSGIVQVFAHAAMVWTLEPLGYGRPVPTGIKMLTTPESPKRIWSSTWAWPNGPDLRTVCLACASQFPTSFLCPMLIDYRSDSVYFGAIGDPEAILSQEHQNLAERFTQLVEEYNWSVIWESVLKRGSINPTIQHGVTAERELADGKTIKRMAFFTPWGIDPTEFFGLEPKLATALSSAPFVSVTGWTQQNSGERHPQAFTIYWSGTAIPTSPDLIAPSNAAQWALAGQINAAFDDLHLTRPVVVEAKHLSRRSSKRHLWQITLQLYGGVTSADIRSRSERFRRAIKAQWLRVDDAPRGCVLYVGAEPGQVELQNAQADSLRLSALDFDQAWQDAGVLGANGDVPHLTNLGHLPHNAMVEVRDFVLPPGVDRTRVRSAVGKLKSGTGNTFIEVRESPDGAASVRLLVSKQNPLPTMVPFDFTIAADIDGFAFATGIEGEPIVFDPTESPHLLVAGTTGAGKSALLQGLLYGAAAKKAEVYIIDPVKGCADFVFLRDYAKAFASDPIEAAAVMKAVYAEVSRRKTLNAEYGVGSVFELPEELRPRRMVVMIDEFTSLIGRGDRVSKQPFDDPEQEAERQLQIAIDLAKEQVGVYAGKFAREARSAGVTLFLGTQKLMAKLLDTLPGGSDLKTNLARILLGKASQGERMSALRAFDDAPTLEGDIPKGRGLWEPLTSTAVAIQAWYTTQDRYGAELGRTIPKLTENERLVLTPFLAKTDNNPFAVKPSSARPTITDDIVVDLGELELSLDDLEPALNAPESETPETASDLTWSHNEAANVEDQAISTVNPAWVIDWGTDEPNPEAASMGRTGPAEVAPDDGQGDESFGIVPEIRRRPHVSAVSDKVSDAKSFVDEF